MYAGLTKCSKPVAASPIERNPRVRTVATSANRGSSVNVLATRVSARSCCSAVTPGTPEKSIGAAGSQARGQAAGSTAAWSCPAGSPAAASAWSCVAVGGGRAVGRALVVSVIGVVGVAGRVLVRCGLAVGAVGVDVRRRVEHRGDAEQGDRAPGTTRPTRGAGRPPRAMTTTRQGEAERAEDGAHGVGELRRLGHLEPVDPRDARRAGEHPAADGDGADGGDRHRGEPTPADARAPGRPRPAPRRAARTCAPRSGARRGSRRRPGGWRRRRPTPVRRPGPDRAARPIPVDRSSSPSVPMATSLRPVRRSVAVAPGGRRRPRGTRRSSSPRRAAGAAVVSDAPTSWLSRSS